MAETYNSGSKYCVTCSYWTGPREVTMSGTYSSVESSQDKGKCVAPGGSNFDQIAFHSCSRWEKWPALK